MKLFPFAVVVDFDARIIRGNIALLSKDIFCKFSDGSKSRIISV